MRKLSSAVLAVALFSAIPAFGEFISTDADFTAIQYSGSEDFSWNFGLYSEDGANALVTGDGNPSNGIAMFWELNYDGLGTLTYSWGLDPEKLTNSITNDLFSQEFAYLTVETVALDPKPNRETFVSDLVLDTDLGILNGNDLYSLSDSDDSFTFTYDNLQTFSAFTLSGATTFEWPGTHKNGYDMAVVIQAGRSEPVVPEPATLGILLFGIAAMALRAIIQKRSIESETSAIA